MNDCRRHAGFPGRIVMLGFGCIGQGSLPLILRHVGTRPRNITLVTGDERGRREAKALDVEFLLMPLTRENYRQVLEPLLKKEVGVVTRIDKRGACWRGTREMPTGTGPSWPIDEARELAPCNNATSLQVNAAVLAGMVWTIENPYHGVVEPDEMDFRRILEIAGEYPGPVIGQYTDWHPLTGRGVLFEADLDLDDPWQFRNVRVS